MVNTLGTVPHLFIILVKALSAFRILRKAYASELLNATIHPYRRQELTRILPIGSSRQS